MIKRIFIIMIFAILCGCNITNPDNCHKKEIFIEDVRGTGNYHDRMDDFMKETGCLSIMDCNKSIIIEECSDY